MVISVGKLEGRLDGSSVGSEVGIVTIEEEGMVGILREGAVGPTVGSVMPTVKLELGMIPVGSKVSDGVRPEDTSDTREDRTEDRSGSPRDSLWLSEAGIDVGAVG